MEVLFQTVTDISSCMTYCIVLLEHPIHPREGNQHVWVYEICKALPKSVGSAFHVDEWAQRMPQKCDFLHEPGAVDIKSRKWHLTAV